MLPAQSSAPSLCAPSSNQASWARAPRDLASALRTLPAELPPRRRAAGRRALEVRALGGEASLSAPTSPSTWVRGLLTSCRGRRRFNVLPQTGIPFTRLCFEVIRGTPLAPQPSRSPVHGGRGWGPKVPPPYPRASPIFVVFL